MMILPSERQDATLQVFFKQNIWAKSYFFRKIDFEFGSILCNLFLLTEI